jgi:hypothetical protein
MKSENMANINKNKAKMAEKAKVAKRIENP